AARGRFAGRTLRKSPVFALTAALAIAPGGGASTALFSVTNAGLLRPLPHKDPDRLVTAVTDKRGRQGRDLPFSNANFIDLRVGTKNVVEHLAAGWSGISCGKPPDPSEFPAQVNSPHCAPKMPVLP